MVFISHLYIHLYLNISLSEDLNVLSVRILQGFLFHRQDGALDLFYRVCDFCPDELACCGSVVSAHLCVDDGTAEVAGLCAHILVILGFEILRILRDIPPLIRPLALDFSTLLCACGSLLSLW